MKLSTLDRLQFGLSASDRHSQPISAMFPLLILTISSAVAEPWCYTDGVNLVKSHLAQQLAA